MPFLYSNLNKVDLAHDTIAWEDYLKSPKSEDLLKLIDIKLNKSLEDLKEDLGKKNFKNLLALVQLTSEEKSALKVQKKEKLTAIIQMFHVSTTSVLGFSSGILGIFLLSSTFAAFVLLTMSAIALMPSILLAKLSVDILSRQEKESIEQYSIQKYISNLLIAANEKTENDKKLIYDEIIQNIKKIIKKKYQAFIDKFQNNPQNYLTAEGLDQLKKYILESNQINEDSTPELKEYFSKWENFKNNLKNPTIQSNEESEIKKLKEQISNKENHTHFSNMDWMSKNKSLVIKTGLSTGLGTTAGNMVFPGVLLALGSAKLTAVNFLGIGFLAGALSTPIGITIAVSIVIAIGLIVATLAIYSQCKIAERNQQLDIIKEKNIALRHVWELEQDSLIQTLSFSKLITELPYVLHSSPKDNTIDPPSPKYSKKFLKVLNSTVSDLKNKKAENDDRINQETIPLPNSTETSSSKHSLKIK